MNTQSYTRSENLKFIESLKLSGISLLLPSHNKSGHTDSLYMYLDMFGACVDSILSPCVCVCLCEGSGG